MKSPKEVLIEDSLKKLEKLIDANLTGLKNTFSIEKSKFVISSYNIVTQEEYGTAWEKFLQKYIAAGWKTVKYYTSATYDKDSDRVYSTGSVYFEINA